MFDAVFTEEDDGDDYDEAPDHTRHKHQDGYVGFHGVQLLGQLQPQTAPQFNIDKSIGTHFLQ